jgi:primosomal protein N' (replication factor Y)
METHSTAAEPPLVAVVALDDALSKVLHYSIPDFLQGATAPGTRVMVPVKNSMRKATVLHLAPHDVARILKPIASIIGSGPVTTIELLKLADWMARYYCCPLHKVLTTIIPSTQRGSSKEKEMLFVEAKVSKDKIAEHIRSLRQQKSAQAKVLDIILSHPKGIYLSDLIQKSTTSRSPVDTLVGLGILSLTKKNIDRSPLDDCEFFQSKKKSLSAEQLDAFLKIKSSLQKHQFATHLLFGVTGSGKTEIYLQAIEEALGLGKSVIFLIPEIVLTSQTVERLRSRFKERIALLHHRLSDGERFDTWNHILSGRAQIVVGARSAIFSPIPNLGLIIVDEEHEGAYKQTDEAPCYNARDVAVMRGKLSSSVVILGSATPSFESFANAEAGKYYLSTLTSRPANSQRAQVFVVDMKREMEKQKGFTLFSDLLLKGIKKRLELGEQTLLLLNKRGYHSCQICLSCSSTITCPRCDVNLTYHFASNILCCHLCDFKRPPPKQCPSCKEENQMKFKGAGTELVERSLHALFPDVRTLRMDADTTRLKGSHQSLCKDFKSGKADILIGTQMIAKGLHFPLVTLVGVLSADISLQIPDFRASESAFQLITQAAGRSGRGDLKGEVVIQTMIPDSSVLSFAKDQDFLSFYQEERASRRLFDYPPYTHLIKCSCKGASEEKVKEVIEKLRSLLIGSLPHGVTLLPATKAGHAKVDNQYRYQFLIKTPRPLMLAPIVEPLIGKLRSSGVKVTFDIDPLSTFF